MSEIGRSPIAAGFDALTHAKLVLLLALTTALLGLSGAMPLMPAMHDAMARTLAGDHFLRNVSTFAPTDFFDFLREKSPAIAGTRRAAGWAGVVGVLLQMVFAGGMVAVLGRGPFGFGQFLEPARRNFWHNVKCFLLFAASAALILGLWFGLEGAVTKKAFEDVPPDAAIRSAVRWGSLVVEVLLFAVLSLLYDFARAARRYAPLIGAFRAYRFARQALSGAWLPALGLWLFWFALGGLAVLVGFAIAWGLPALGRFMIVMLLLLQFAALWARSAVRVAAWGSWVAFLDPRAREAISGTARVRYSVASTVGLPATPSPRP